MKIKFEEIGVGRRFDFEDHAFIKISNDHAILFDLTAHHLGSHYFDKDEVVTLIDTCLHCKHYYDYDDHWCDTVKNHLHEIDIDPTTFTCANFEEKEKE